MSDVTVQIENIPQRFKQRDRWLLWDADSELRRPYTKKNGRIKGASFNEESDWLTFDEAVAAAEEHNSVGIGLAILPSDKEYIIDIDGPFDENGEYREWVPKLDKLPADAYMEWSPSENGIHTPIEGEPPEWWRDSDVDGADHQGVDVLTNSFCSFTGDTLEQSGESVTDSKPGKFLLEAYYNIRGEHPRFEDEDDDDSSDYNGGDLSKEQVEDALVHVDEDLHYNDWLKLGFAVYDWDDGSTGKRVFENWSRTNSKWEKERGQPHINDIWDNDSARGDVTVGTLVHYAKDGGWKPPAAGWKRGDDTLQDAEKAASVLDEKLQDYEGEDNENDPNDDKRRRIGKLVAALDDEGFEDLRDRAANVLDTSGAALDRHRELLPHYIEDGPILVADGKTWYLSGTPLKKYELLNFELDVKSFLEVPGEPQRAELGVDPIRGDRFDKPIEAKIFKRRQRFEDELLSEQFGLTFDTLWLNDDEALDVLNEYIAGRDAPRRKGTHHMGLHGSEFVTPEGSLTPDGWTEEPETVYLPRELTIERNVSLSTETAKFDEEDVGTILRELPRTRATDRMLPVLGWFYAAPFSPFIREWGRSGFNILNITGDTGSGKTTTLRYLWRCFGMGGEPFDATDTWFVLISTFGATNSIPIWHDEYKPSDMTNRERNRFHDALKKTATGSVAQRGNADKSTEEYKMQAPSVVSGEQQIQPPAERRRSIMVSFLKETTDPGSDTRTAFKQLVGSGRIEDGELKLPEDAPDTEHHARAYYRWACERDEEDLRERWHDAREAVWKHRDSWESDVELDDMETQGLQTIVFGWRLYRDFAESVGVDADQLPGREELDDALKQVAGAVGPNGQRKSHLDRFIELFERVAANEMYLDDGQQYTVVKEGRPGSEELRINVSRAYDKISKYVRDHDLDEDLLDAAAYRERFKTAYEKPDSYVKSFDQYTPGVSNCVGVSTLAAVHELDFSRETFGLAAFDEEALQEDLGGDDDGDGDSESEHPTAAEDRDSGQPAAADGGTEAVAVPSDATGPGADAKRIAQYLNQQGRSFDQPELNKAVTLDADLMDPERFKRGLDRALRDGLVREDEDGIWSNL